MSASRRAAGCIAVGIASLAIGGLAPNRCRACACGCGIFDVGTSAMLPEDRGGLLFFEYDFQNQNVNWNGSHRAPAADNPDKKLQTSFYTLGMQYMFTRDWGLQVQLPVADRYFKFTGGAGGNQVVHSSWADLGDLRVQGIYDGFFPDQSAGVAFGLKLTTGNYTHNNAYGDIDRDSEIGTGSTDLLLGGFFRHQLTSDEKFDWFAQASVDVPLLTRDEYRPGIEADGAAGIYFNGLSIGRMDVVPIAQVIAAVRGQDTGANAANPVASGYTRVLLSPGIEFHFHPVMVYADVELPVYQHFTGNQLSASYLVKIIVSYKF